MSSLLYRNILVMGAAWTHWLAGSLIAAGIALGCALALLCVSPALQWYKRMSSPASPSLPPGRSFGFLCISETINYLRALRDADLSSFLQVRTAKYGSKTFRTSVFFHPTVVVQGVAANRFIVVAENKKQLFNTWPSSVIEILGKHIPPAMHGSAHRRLRQIIASCVGPLALQKLVGKADLMTCLHFERCWQVQSQISLVSLIKDHAFSVACSLLAGAEEQELVVRLRHQFRVWTAGSTAFPLNLPGTAFRKAKNAKKMLVHEVSKLIDCKEELKNADDHDAQGNEDMLGMLLRASDETGSFLEREELLDVMLFLLFAGHDTAAATLAFALKFLEQSPACYHHLCQEHTAIASQKKQGETLSWSDVQNMKYTWAVIQETLRLRPPILGGIKEVKEDVIFDGYKIPRGWKVFFNMSSTHENETFFQEPSLFDPSRFDTIALRDGYKPPPYVYIPFGIGPHSCPGGDFARMFMSIYLHHLALGQLKWQSLDPNEKISAIPILELANGYMANIFPMK